MRSTYASRSTQLPGVPKGAPLGDWLSIIVPEATTNLVLNPSLERATTGYTASNGSSVARSATRQARGAYSLAVTPSSNVNSGVYYTPGAVTATQVYTYGVDVWGAPGVPYRAVITDSSANILARVEFRGEGRWRRYHVSVTPGVTAIRLYVEKNNSTSTAVFYVDGLQLESKAYPTTYTDGDMVGFVPTRNDFYWTGAAHASTSVRSAQTRAGGRLMNLNRFGFTLMTILGLGMLSWAHVAQPAGLVGGRHYQRSVPAPHDFTVVGDMREATRPQLDRRQASLADVLRPDLVSPTQPMVLRYQMLDDCTQEPLGDALDIVCAPTGGPGNALDNRHQETVTIPFTTFMPLIYHELSAGAALDYQDSMSAAYLAKRSAAGLWSALGTSATGAADILTIVESPVDGKIYIGGQFTNLNGDANMDGIAVYDPVTGTLSALGTGVAGGVVYALAVDAAGGVYAGGDFTSAGGVANTDNIAYWNGSAWTAVGTGVTAAATVLALHVGRDGTLYAGGTFTGMSGVANTTRLAKWNGSAWTAMGTGADSEVWTFTEGLDGVIYIGGLFTQLNGVNNTRVGRWDPSTGAFLAAMSSGANGFVKTSVTLPNGDVVYGGEFTTIGGISASRVARWTGTAFDPLGAGLDAAGAGRVNALAYDRQRSALIAVGVLAESGDLSLSGGIAVWNGTTWTLGDVTPPSSYISSVAVARDGQLYLGFSASGTLKGSGVTTLAVGGSVDTYPRLEFVGPGRLYELRNVTTGKSIYFNVTLLASERAVLELQPDRVSFTSTFRGDISHLILPGSQESGWALQADADNSVALYIGGTTDANTAAVIVWREAESGVQGGTQ